MRIEQEEIHAVEPDTIDLGIGSQIEHRIQVNARFGAGAALADEPGPHGVVKFWEIAVTVLRAHNGSIG